MKIKAWFNSHPVVKDSLKAFFEGFSSIACAFLGGWFAFFAFFAFICDQFPGFVEWLKLL